MNSEHVISITSRQQLVDCIQQASDKKTPLCVYRSSVPTNGSRLVLDHFNKLIAIDADNLVATVEPGLTMGELADSLAAKGLRFIPADTPYYRHLSVGEWVYRGCPNPSAWKYGPGKHTVMGSTYILPTGKCIRVGGKTVKNVTGYDFTRFLAGAYSDIGIGVEFLLKLLPQPEHRNRFCVGFESLEDAFGFINKLRQNPIAPAFLMAMDSKASKMLLGLSDTAPYLLEFELDGVREEVESFAKNVHLWAKQNQSCSLTSITPESGEISFCSQALFASQKATVICDEWKILYDQQCPLLQNLEKELPQVGWFGQWAEGKLHAVINASPLEITDKVNAISKLVTTAGGISSGIYQRQLGQIPSGPLKQLELTLRRRIDPHGILTPREVLL